VLDTPDPPFGAAAWSLAWPERGDRRAAVWAAGVAGLTSVAGQAAPARQGDRSSAMSDSFKSMFEWDGCAGARRVFSAADTARQGGHFMALRRRGSQPQPQTIQPRSRKSRRVA